MKIAILGGGIAGVSSAIALRQKGFDVSIYERQGSASTIGAGIVVWPNAAYVLEQLGVLDEIEAIAGRLTRMHRLSSTNEYLGFLDIEKINSHMGYSSLSILRSDLQSVLISKLQSLGVSIQYTHTVTRIKTIHTGQAEVHFQNGAKVTADVLIGADGRMASHARQYVNGDNVPVYQGFINWIGVYESEDKAFEEIAVTDYWGVGERFGIVPVTEYKAYWAGGVASYDIEPRDENNYKAELESIFSNWPSPIQRIIRETKGERINKIYVHDHNPIHRWHKNNLIVIGDAAHAALPTSGQGACQALEDAWHLAVCLYKTPYDLQKAFTSFTQIRFKKTAGITMSARGLASSLFSRDKDFCTERNNESKNTDFAKAAEAISRSWSQHLPLNM